MQLNIIIASLTQDLDLRLAITRHKILRQADIINPFSDVTSHTPLQVEEMTLHKLSLEAERRGNHPLALLAVKWDHSNFARQTRSRLKTPAQG